MLSPSNGYFPVVMLNLVHNVGFKELYTRESYTRFKMSLQWVKIVFKVEKLILVRRYWMTHSVTPLLHTSTLNPENFSAPLAISGGWKAGEPWLVKHVSSAANMSSAWTNQQTNQKSSWQNYQGLNWRQHHRPTTKDTNIYKSLF